MGLGAGLVSWCCLGSALGCQVMACTLQRSSQSGCLPLSVQTLRTGKYVWFQSSIFLRPACQVLCMGVGLPSIRISVCSCEKPGESAGRLLQCGPSKPQVRPPPAPLILPTRIPTPTPQTRVPLSREPARGGRAAEPLAGLPAVLLLGAILCRRVRTHWLPGGQGPLQVRHAPGPGVGSRRHTQVRGGRDEKERERVVRGDSHLRGSDPCSPS